MGLLTYERKGMPSEVYHASPEMSSSKLGDFLRSPSYFWHKYLSPERQQEESSPALEEGTIAHEVLFQPDLFRKKYVRTELPRRGTKEWLASEALNPGRVLMKAHEYDKWMKASETLSGHHLVRQLLEEGEAELSVFGPIADLQCKGRFDFVQPGKVVVDLKKTRELDTFERTSVTYGYHRQAWIYTELHKLVFGVEVPFYFIAFEAEYPFPVRVFQAGKDYLDAGKREVLEGLESYKQCVTTNEWPDNSGPYLLELPRWYKEKYSEQ